jgi:hypothetical protein
LILSNYLQKNKGSKRLYIKLAKRRNENVKRKMHKRKSRIPEIIFNALYYISGGLLLVGFGSSNPWLVIAGTATPAVTGIVQTKYNEYKANQPK